ILTLFFFQAEDGIRDGHVTGVQTCALPISAAAAPRPTYDPIIQALSGLTTVQAGSDAARPRLVRTVLPDKLTAVTAAQAISAARSEERRVGKEVRRRGGRDRRRGNGSRRTP